MAEKNNQKRGERVKAALKSAGITQRDLAEKLFFTPNYINQVIRGKRNLTDVLAKKISDLTGVRAEYLLGIDDYKTKREAIQKSRDYIAAYNEGVDSYIELVSIIRLNMTLRIEKNGDPEKVYSRLQEAASKTYVFTNNDDLSVKLINGVRFEKFRCDLMDYAEFLLRQIMKEGTEKEPLHFVPCDLIPGTDPTKEE